MREADRKARIAFRDFWTLNFLPGGGGRVGPPFGAASSFRSAQFLARSRVRVSYLHLLLQCASLRSLWAEVLAWLFLPECGLLPVVRECIPRLLRVLPLIVFYTTWLFLSHMSSIFLASVLPHTFSYSDFSCATFRRHAFKLLFQSPCIILKRADFSAFRSAVSIPRFTSVFLLVSFAFLL